MNEYDFIIDSSGNNAPASGGNGDGTISAIDAGDAAEKACEQQDQYGDYDILSAGEVTVYVRSTGEQDWQAYTVTAETVPMYSAHKKRGITPAPPQR